MKKTTDKAILKAAADNHKAKARKKEAAAIEESTRAAILAKMDALGVDELQAGEFIIKRSTSAQIRVDTTRLKRERPELAAEFAKQITVHHFNIGKK